MDVVDLTEEDDTPVIVQPISASRERSDAENAQRKRIMDFASAKVKELNLHQPKRQRTLPPMVSETLNLPSTSSHTTSGAVSASQAAAEPHPQAEGTAGLEPNTAAVSQPVDCGNLTRQLHFERLSRMSQSELKAMTTISKTDNKSDGGASTQIATTNVSILTYNVWFKEEVALEERMAGIGAIIEGNNYPDILLFQEVTHNISLLWSRSPWWQYYQASPVPPRDPYFTMILIRRHRCVPLQPHQPFTFQPFDNSLMGRGLHVCRCRMGAQGPAITLATCHLESPVGADLYSHQRRQQAQLALKQLVQEAGTGDIVLGGDMNWDDKRDGALELPPGWQDAWTSANPTEAGFTYDPRKNEMIGTNFPSQRFDRFLVKPAAWRVAAVRLVGKDPVPGAFTEHPRSKKTLRVYPSDHFGLLLTLQPNTTAGS